MSGKYSYSGVRIKLEKLSESESEVDVEVSTAIEDSTPATPTPTNDGDDVEVEVLSPPKKVVLVVSLDDEERSGPGHVYNNPETDEDTVASESEKVDVADGPSNKKQKLMINNPSSSSRSCSSTCYDTNTSSSREASSCSTMDLNLNDSPLVKIVDEKIVFDVKSQEELNRKLEFLAKLPDICSVKIIKIQSDPEDNLFIGYKQIKALCSMSLPHLEKLHIGLNFHESITSKLFEDLLVKFGDTLVHFHVTGGYIGVKKEEFVVRMPPLPKLEHFAFQSIYNFDTDDEVIGPDKVVGLDVLEDDKIPTSNGLFRISLFLPKLKCLKEMILGNYIKVITTDPLKSTVEKFSFEYFKSLEVFKVGSPWNELVHFIPPKNYKVVLKEIQFPDLLKDAYVLGKIAEIFPNLESIRLNLPSPFVLQQFIQIFSKLKIKKLYLRTSFIVEGTDVKILCGLYNAKEGEEERKIAWFGSHGNLDGFEDSDESEFEIVNSKNKGGKNLRKSKTPPKPEKMLGLGSLKTLTTFCLYYLPRFVYYSKYKKTCGVDYSVKEFPVQDQLANFIQEFNKLKNINQSSFPQFGKAFEDYLTERFGGIKDVYDDVYPNLLKVKKTDAGVKKINSDVNVNVKQENRNRNH